METRDIHIDKPSVHAISLERLPEPLRTAVEAAPGVLIIGHPPPHLLLDTHSNPRKKQGLINRNATHLDSRRKRRNLVVKEYGPKYRYLEQHIGEYVKQGLLMTTQRL